MSRSVRERILDLEADVQQVRLAPAADVRRRGRQRGRRRIALTASSFVLVAALAGLGLSGILPGRGADPAAVEGPRCASVDLSLPAGPESVAVRVVNGTAQAGRDETAAEELRRRSFSQARSGGDAAVALSDQAAMLVYGPRAVGNAQFLRAFVPGRVVMSFDPARDDATVDVVLGPGFRGLATPTEINQALVELGPVTTPPQCRSGS